MVPKNIYKKVLHVSTNFEYNFLTHSVPIIYRNKHIWNSIITGRSYCHIRHAQKKVLAIIKKLMALMFILEMRYWFSIKLVLYKKRFDSKFSLELIKKWSWFFWYYSFFKRQLNMSEMAENQENYSYQLIL